MPATAPMDSRVMEAADHSTPDATDASDGAVTDSDKYPDGGTRAWLTVLGCFCSLFAGLSIMNSAGAYQNWLLQDQLRGASSSEIGWIFGFANFFTLFVGLPLGPVFDARGPRTLSLCGAVLLLATYLVLSVCKQYWHFFLSFGVLGSCSASLLFTSAIGTVQHWFLRHRGAATGLAISGASVGGIVSPLVLSSLLPRIGFAWAMRAMALIMAPLVTIGVVLMRSRIQPSDEGRGRGFIPDLRILQAPRMCVLVVGVLFIELGIFIPVTYLTSYATSHNMSSATAYRMVTLLNVGTLLGRWPPGWLGDKIGRFNAQIAALALCVVSLLAIWLPAGHTTAGLTVFAILFGFGSGSGLSLVPVCIGQLCKTEDYGKTLTTAYSISSFGCLIGVPLGGQILQATNGDYLGVIVLAGAAYAIALSKFVAVRVMSVGVRGTTKF